MLEKSFLSDINDKREEKRLQGLISTVLRLDRFLVGTGYSTSSLRFMVLPKRLFFKQLPLAKFKQNCIFIIL